MNIFKNNPTFVLLLGLCPALAVTTSATDALSMGVATLLVLLGSNLTINMIKSSIPSTIRMPVYIVILSTFVTIIQLLLKAFLPALGSSLGIYIPLIVVNCIILGNMNESLLEWLEKGLGFMAGLMILGTIREIMGSGTLFGFTVIPDYYPMLIMILPPGAFLIMGCILGGINWVKAKRGQP